MKSSSKNLKDISVVIATFNGQKTLPLVLESISNQTFPQKKIETLLIDGGSTDSTPELAKSFGCKFINNPYIEPVSARRLGYKKARGKYMVFIDQDEVINNKRSFEIKYSLLHN